MVAKWSSANGFGAQSQTTQLPKVFSEARKLPPSSTQKGVDEAHRHAELLHRVFQQDEDGRNAPTNEGFMLPRLLDRLTHSVWGEDRTKRLETEIQALKQKREAASELLDDIEQEAQKIEETLQRKKQKKANMPQGFLSSCQCSPQTDKGELLIGSSAPRRVTTKLELRPALRAHIEEAEHALADRDAELRQLRHELNSLRQEKELSRQTDKNFLLEGGRSAKDAMLQHFASAFHVMQGSQLQLAFTGWQQLMRRKALAEKMIKQTFLALEGKEGHGVLGLAFTSWKTWTQDTVHRKQQARDAKRAMLAQKYAAQFAGQSTSMLRLTVFVEWLRVTKESLLRARLSKMESTMKEAQQSSRHHPETASAGKACCTMM